MLEEQGYGYYDLTYMTLEERQEFIDRLVELAGSKYRIVGRIHNYKFQVNRHNLKQKKNIILHSIEQRRETIKREAEYLDVLEEKFKCVETGAIRLHRPGEHHQ